MNFSQAFVLGTSSSFCLLPTEPVNGSDDLRRNCVCQLQMTQPCSCSLRVVWLMSDRARNCTAYVPPLSPLLLTSSYQTLSSQVRLSSCCPAGLQIHRRRLKSKSSRYHVKFCLWSKRAERRSPGNKKGQFGETTIYELSTFTLAEAGVCWQRSRVGEPLRLFSVPPQQQQRLVIPSVGHRWGWAANRTVMHSWSRAAPANCNWKAGIWMNEVWNSRTMQKKTKCSLRRLFSVRKQSILTL